MKNQVKVYVNVHANFVFFFLITLNLCVVKIVKFIKLVAELLWFLLNRDLCRIASFTFTFIVDVTLTTIVDLHLDFFIFSHIEIVVQHFSFHLLRFSRKNILCFLLLSGCFSQNVSLWWLYLPQNVGLVIQGAVDITNFLDVPNLFIVGPVHY